MTIRYAGVLLVAALVVTAIHANGAQADQHMIAQELLGQDFRERNSAFEAALAIGPGNAGQELRLAAYYFTRKGKPDCWCGKEAWRHGRYPRYEVEGGLTALRLMVEGAGPRPLTSGAIDQIRRAARSCLVAICLGIAAKCVNPSAFIVCNRCNSVAVQVAPTRFVMTNGGSHRVDASTPMDTQQRARTCLAGAW